MLRTTSLSLEIRSWAFLTQVIGFNRSTATFSCVLDYRSPSLRSSSCRVMCLNKHRQQRVIKPQTDRMRFWPFSSGAFVKLRKATVSYVMSVRPTAWNISAPTGRIFMKFYISEFFENLSKIFKFHYI